MTDQTLLFTHISSILIPAQPSLITSEDYFRGVNIQRMGEDFRQQFFGMVIPPTGSTCLAIKEVNRDIHAVYEDHILSALDKKAEVSVSQFCQFLLNVDESHDDLSFYCCNRKGKLRRLEVTRRRLGYGWNVQIRYFFGKAYGLIGGTKIVSRA
jgi:hypothetical protein